MSFIRKSKYRHVFGKENRRDKCYESIRITKTSSIDSNFCAVNPKFVAVATEAAGGGAFLVLPLDKVGRVDVNHPQVAGHKSAVLDIAWSPFNDNIIASASEDTTIKIWEIPDEGLVEPLLVPLVTLNCHQRKTYIIDWHPVAENIILSVGADPLVLVWDLEKGSVITTIDCHPDLIFCASWNYNGSLIGTTCKDKKIRVIDPRTGKVKQVGDGHAGSKPQRIKLLKDNKAFTTGFSRMSDRQYALWDVNDFSKPLSMEDIDKSNGTLMIFYDPDTSIIYLSGKGDGKINYYEVTSEDPYVFWLSLYQSSEPTRGLGWMPKRGCNVNINEVARFFKLHSKGLCEPIAMTVPRKSELFQVDLYPDTASNVPALKGEEWFSGKDKEPNLLSMKDFFAVKTNTAAVSSSGISGNRLSQLSHKADDAKAASKQSAAKTEPPKSKVSFKSTTSEVNNTEAKDQKKQIEELAAELQRLKATVSSQEKRIETLEQRLASENGN